MGLQSGLKWVLKGVQVIQSRFRSRIECTLDAKGRFNFPKRFRDVLHQSGSEILMVAPWKTHLRAYPISEWESLETKLLTQGGEQPGLGRFVRYVVGGVAECLLDKQGRIRLPPDLRTDANLTKEIVLTGMVHWVEIWDKDAAQADTQATRDDFDGHQESLSRMGIL